MSKCHKLQNAGFKRNKGLGSKRMQTAYSTARLEDVEKGVLVSEIVWLRKPTKRTRAQWNGARARNRIENDYEHRLRLSTSTSTFG